MSNDLADHCSPTSGLVSLSRPSISTVTVSPGFINTGGLRVLPMPGGVPVMMTSPCTGYLGHPFKNKHVETENDLLPLLANTDGSLYNQTSSTEYSYSNDDTLM